MLRKSALQQYPVAVVQYAEADWGAAVGKQQSSSGYSRWQGQGEDRGTCVATNGALYRVSSKVRSYLVQVRHEVLVERADQHVEGPLSLLGKRRCLQCGFLSIDYCRTRNQIRKLKNRGDTAL